MLPESRGAAIMNGTSPYNPPAIYPNYFDQKIDLDNVVNAIKEQASFANSRAFKAKSARLIRVPLKKCDEFEYQSDEYWKCYVKIISASGMHERCTNKMGPSSNPTTVVDSELRVHGIPNLRVVDSSM